jgi:hypothetical protein
MKKISLIVLSVILFGFLSINFVSATTNYCADITSRTGCSTTGLVRCGNVETCPCCFEDIMATINQVISFIVWDIATPAAILFFIIGGILILVSAGNANLLSLGKQILLSTVIGLVLIFCAWLIVSFILTGLGYQKPGGGSWYQF